MDNNFNNAEQNQQPQYEQQPQQAQQTAYQQPQFQQPVYQQPVYQQPQHVEDTSVMTTGQWMVTTLIMGLPCIGLIMTFVWAFGDGNVNRKNYCRSVLIWMLIGIGASLLIGLIMGIAGASLFGALGGGGYYY